MTFYIIAVVMVSPIYAYLDPGSASLLLQAIIGFIAATSVTIGLYWQKIKKGLKKVFSKKQSSKEIK